MSDNMVPYDTVSALEPTQVVVPLLWSSTNVTLEYRVGNITE